MESQLIKSMQFYHLARRGGVLLVSIILVKLGLTTDEIGVFETWLYLLMLFSFFWVESLIKSYLSIYSDESSWSSRKGAATIYLLFFCISSILGGILFGFKGFILNWTTGETDLLLYNYFVLYMVILPPTMIIPFVYQIQKNKRGIRAFAIFVLIGFFSSVSIPLIMGWGLSGVIKGMIWYAMGGQIWALSLFVFPSIRKGLIIPRLLKNVLFFGWPLIIYSIIQSLTTLVDSALVQWFYQDKSSFAIFRYGARELPLVAPLTVGVVNLAIPLMVSKWDEGLDLLQREGRKLMHILFPISIFLVIFSSFLFKWVYSNDFVQSADIFNIYLLLIISHLVFPQTLIISKRWNKVLVIVGVLEVGINVTLTWLFIHKWGMLGVAWATVIAFFVEKSLLILFVNKVLGIRFDRYTPWKLWLLYSSILITTYLVFG